MIKISYKAIEHEVGEIFVCLKEGTNAYEN